MMVQALNVPSVRFIEKAGTTVIQDVGQSYPWASDKFCPRTNCWHCQGRYQLLKEEEERMVQSVTGEATSTCPPEDTRTSLPGCTSKGINFVSECGNCRDKGVRRQYWGESSRSAFQRGGEHEAEIQMGKISHPMVQHFWEEHGAGSSLSS